MSLALIVPLPPTWWTWPMKRGLSPCVNDAGALTSTKKSFRTVKLAVVWPTRVSAPVTPLAENSYSESAVGALNVTRALPSGSVTIDGFQ